MDGLSLAASVITVIQIAGFCLKTSKKWIGPSQFDAADLSTITSTLYGLIGALEAFHLYLQINEDDEARLGCLEYLRPALSRCRETLDIIKDFLDRSSSISKLLRGLKFDSKVKASLKAIDAAKDLFMAAREADHQ
jgi:hypothetical protein